jgi:crossover junction endodeoxyribonuclease RusA
VTEPLIVKVPGRPFSLNAERSKHWSDRAARVAQLRQDAKYCALQAMPFRRRESLFQQVDIEVFPWAKDRRYRQDVGNNYPTFKACLDGLVDAGVIMDDDDTHVHSVKFYPHQYGVDQMVLVVTEWGDDDQ